MKKIVVALFSLLFFIVAQADAKVRNPNNRYSRDAAPETVQNIDRNAGMSEQDVPPELRNWIKWATYGHKSDECVYGAVNKKEYCRYLSEVKIDVAAETFSFTMRLKTMKDGYVEIIGTENAFPTQVVADNVKIPVVSRAGRPHVYLKKGEYFLKGKGKSSNAIRHLYIPKEAAIIEVTENGKSTSAYTLQNGVLRLENNTVSKKSATDTVSLTVYRKITDGIPLKMTVYLDMSVSGKDRTENLGKIIPKNFAVKSITSPFPTYLRKDGSLMAEVRAGRHAIEIEFRQLKESLDVSVDLLSDQELWVFEKDESFRIIEPPVYLTGVDAKNTSMPAQWKRFPAYIVEKDTNVVLSVGPEVRNNNDVLSLSRNIKLSFGGDFYSVEDTIAPNFKNDGRLTLAKPFVLSAASVNTVPVPITSISGERNSGIEVRKGDAAVDVTSRIASDVREIAVSGYNRVFDNVAWTLVLAPGYKLFHVIGADKVSSSWINSWDLLGVFEVMVLIVVFYYLFGIRTAFLSGVGLLLMHPLLPEFTYVSFVMALLIFILRYFPEKTFISSALKYVKNTLLLIMIFYLIRFFVPNLVNSVYPETLPVERIDINYVSIISFYLFSAFFYALYRIFTDREKSSIKKVLQGGGIIIVGLILLNNVGDFDFNDRYYQQAVKHHSYELAEAPVMSAPLKRKALSSSSNFANDAVDVKAHKYQSLNIAKNVVQTGFGFPTWNNKKKIYISFSGSVDEKDTVKILLMTPVMNMVLAFLRFVLIAYVMYMFAGKRGTMKVMPKAAAMAAFLLIMAGGIVPANAAEYPSAEMLKELRERLTAKKIPECLAEQSCISYPVAYVSNKGDLLSIKLTAYSLEKLVAPLPEVKADGSGQASLKSVTIGKKNADLTKDGDRNTVLLNKGENDIEMLFHLDRNAEKFILLSPFRINTLESKLDGFSIYAVRGVDQSYQINRKITSKVISDEKENKINIEAFFTVERNFDIGNVWQVSTIVRKETKNQKPSIVDIPLIKGEKVISSEGVLSKNKIRLSFAANETVKTFHSLLPVEEPINLVSSDNLEKYRELWRFTVSNLWSVKYEGIKPTTKDTGKATEFYPGAGKTLTANIFRPESVPGNVVTFDNVAYDIELQKDFTSLSLRLSLRSSEGGMHNIAVPADLTVKSLHIANRPYPIMIKDGMLSLPINQGKNDIRILLKSEKKPDDIFTAPNIDLNAPAVDVYENIKVPHDRWVVFTKGPLKGPAVLFIPLVPVLLIVSVFLSRLKLSPLGAVSWFVLLLGLSQTNIVCNFLVIAWFVAMGAREKYSLAILPWKRTVQWLLGVMSFFFVIALLSSIKDGLLGYPHMYIRGNNSTVESLKWYADAISGVTPDVMIVSLSSVFYKAAMLLWAIWLSFSFVKWVRWAISVYCKDGIWVNKGIISEEVTAGGKPKNNQ